MSRKLIWRIAGSDYLKLAAILALAFYIAFIPHRNYPFPVHLDEWIHLAYSRSIMQGGDVRLIEPFFGQDTLGIGSNLEAGFQMFWGVFQGISGISWLTVFRFFPGIIFMITVLSVYILARREGFGWESALFTTLIPTTVGILGPAFMVPVAMALIFVPLSLFTVFNFKTRWSYLALFLFTSFLLVIHAPTAVGLAIIMIPYILLNLKSDFKHSLGIALALASPFLVPFPWILGLLLPTAGKLLTPQPLASYIQFPLIIKAYGYLPFALSLLGIFWLVMKGDRKNLGLVLGLAAMLAMLVVYFTFHYGLSIMYERGLMYMMLMVSIIAGAGLAAVKNLPAGLVQVKLPPVAANAGKFICLGLVILTLVLAIPARQNTAYYSMIDSVDYEAFMWVRDNIDGRYQEAILDPWKATAFTAITGKNVYTRIHAYPLETDNEAYQFLEKGSSDTAFLKAKGISIVYTRSSVTNPDLVEVRQYVYLLKTEGVSNTSPTR